MKISHLLIAAAVASGFAASPIRAGSNEPGEISHRSYTNAHMIIRRAPDFGTEQHFNLFVDGRYVASLGYGESYDGFFPPGEHVVTVKQVPHLNDAYPFTHTLVRLVAGEPNVYTAIWRNAGESAVLERSYGQRPAIF